MTYSDYECPSPQNRTNASICAWRNSGAPQETDRRVRLRTRSDRSRLNRNVSTLELPCQRWAPDPLDVFANHRRPGLVVVSHTPTGCNRTRRSWPIPLKTVFRSTIAAAARLGARAWHICYSRRRFRTIPVGRKIRPYTKQADSSAEKLKGRSLGAAESALLTVW